MTDPALLIALGSAGTVAVSATAATALKGWKAWLDVRRLELEGGRAPSPASKTAPADLVELRERVRRLEAIANGGQL